MTAIDHRTEALLAAHTTVLDDGQLAAFEAEVERFATDAVAERDARQADARDSRVRRRVIGTLLAVVLAVAGFVGYHAYEQHLAEVAVAEAAHARVVAAADQARLDDAFYAARADLANTARAEAWQAEHEARETAAVETIEADLDAAREVLASSKGRVLDDGKQARTDLAEAIDAREALLADGSLHALEDAAGTPLDTAAVTEAVEAWEAEQARIEAERIAAEQAAREAAAREAAQRTTTPTSPSSSSSSSTSTSAGTTQTSPSSSSGGSQTSSSTPASSRTNATIAAAEAAAAKYGVSVSWVTSNCGGTGYATADAIWIAGCSYGNGTIQLSVGGQTPSEAGWAQAVARQVALHEVAHELIARQCGTVQPAVAGARFESVTDAYAALYLGTGPAPGGYGYTAADAAIAQQIHAGVCS